MRSEGHEVIGGGGGGLPGVLSALLSKRAVFRRLPNIASCFQLCDQSLAQI